MLNNLIVVIISQYMYVKNIMLYNLKYTILIFQSCLKEIDKNRDSQWELGVGVYIACPKVIATYLAKQRLVIYSQAFAAGRSFQELHFLQSEPSASPISHILSGIW